MTRAAPAGGASSGPSAAQSAGAPPLLTCSGVHKHYGAVHALRGVDLEIQPGEFIGLVGDNGAGKSTLVKVIAGALQPSKGGVSVDGVPARFSSPTAARARGIETVYQDLGLCDNLSVAENLFLGREIARGWGPFRALQRKEMLKASGEALSRLSMNVPPARAKVAALSGGQRQAVALARARLWNQRLVLLDEPTAALGVEETRNCVKTIREIHASGAALVLIAHDIPLIRELTQRVIVMRRGQKVADVRTTDVSEHDIVGLITGAGLRGAEPSGAEPSDDAASASPTHSIPSA